MAWYKPKDIIENVTDFLGGGGATSSTVQEKALPARDADSSKIWSDFMGQYSNLLPNLQGQNSYGDSIFSNYTRALKPINSEYQGTISGLMSGLNSDDNKIAFGMEGSSPVSFTSRQDRQDASLLNDLAANLMTNKSMIPTAIYQHYNENNPYKTNLKYFDIVANLAKQLEDRRAGLATTTESFADTSKTGLLGMLTGIGETAKAGSELSNTLSKMGGGSSAPGSDFMSSILGALGGFSLF